MEITAATSFANREILPEGNRVHIIGAGPVGLFLAALLQSTEKFPVRLYEKRQIYTRTRMVKLSSFLAADSVESYCEDHVDGQTIQAVFDIAELEETLAFRRSIPPDLMSLIRTWVQGFCPLNTIEQALSNLIDERGSKNVERIEINMAEQEAIAMLRPGDILIDCTGCKSLFRDHLVPGPEAGKTDANTFNIHLENAIVVTFVYGQQYDCNEYCKYYKNIDNAYYKFIPAVNRTYSDGSITHVTGIVNISAEDYERMPSRFDGHWLRSNFPHVAESMDRFITKVKEETNGEIVGDLEIIRIPLDLYRARNATSREVRRTGSSDHPFTRSPVFLVGDSSMGSPYFQSISLGFECAMFLAGLLVHRDLALTDMLDRYELYAYKQWLRVYMRSKTIKQNKDLLECVGDNFALLEKLHIY